MEFAPSLRVSKEMCEGVQQMANGNVSKFKEINFW